MLQQNIEQRVQVVAVGNLAVGGRHGAGDPGAPGRVQGRQAERFLGSPGGLGVQIGRNVEQQVMAGVDHLGDARIGAVGFVDDEDHRQMGSQRLAQHEPGLRQRTLGGVDQQQHPVDHGQPALDFAAEIRVPGCIDHVDDGDAAIRVMAVHGGVFGQDRDALFPLQVAAVQHSLSGLAALVQRAGLPQHGVDQRRLTVVDVGDNGDVAEIHAGDSGSAGSR